MPVRACAVVTKSPRFMLLMSLPTVLLPGFSSITRAMSSCTWAVWRGFMAVTKKVSSVIRLTAVIPPLSGRLMTPRRRPSRMGLRLRRSTRALSRSCSPTSRALSRAARTRSSQSLREIGTRRRNHEAMGFSHLDPNSEEMGRAANSTASPSSSRPSTASSGMRARSMLPRAPASHEAIRRAAASSPNSSHASVASWPLTCAARARR